MFFVGIILIMIEVFVIPGFGIFGMFLRMVDIPILPFVIAAILARPLEATSRQAFSALGGDPWFLFSSPTSIGLIAACFVIIFYFIRKNAHDKA